MVYGSILHTFFLEHKDLLYSRWVLTSLLVDKSNCWRFQLLKNLVTDAQDNLRAED